MSNCDTCKESLDQAGIAGKNMFKYWALRNHPDKGGDMHKFQSMSDCNDKWYGKQPVCHFQSPVPPRKHSPTSKPKKRSTRSPRKYKTKTCSANKILNPKTGRCVRKSGAIGRRLSAKRVPKASYRRGRATKSCSRGKVRNPASGRCVKRSGRVGRRL